jgi:hypothetical protein
VAQRLQIFLTRTHYEFLRAESKRSSVSMGELIRRAIDSTYSPDGARRVHLITHTLGRRSGVRLPD